MQRKPITTRRGESLIIMLATIAAGAVIAGVAIVVLMRIMSFNGAATEHLTRTVAVARLAEQFRCDAAAARSVVASVPAIDANEQAVPDDAEAAKPRHRLQLTLGGGHSITYSSQKSGIERLVEKDGQRQHVDRFAPPGLTVETLDVVPSAAGTGALQFARLRLAQEPQAASHLPLSKRSVTIESQVGRDHRFGPRDTQP